MNKLQVPAELSGRADALLLETYRAGYKAGLGRGIDKLQFLSSMVRPASFRSLRGLCERSARELAVLLESGAER
jgi:hypothetical protein